MPLTLTLPWPPSANRYWRHNRGITHRSDSAVSFIEEVGKICLENRVRPVSCPVAVTVQAYRPARRGDLDNSLKVTLDSLRGFAYGDDSQIVELHAFRHDDKADPRIVVTIDELPEPETPPKRKKKTEVPTI
jgi:crossover junction endodeoxyribonuclease RusA